MSDALDHLSEAAAGLLQQVEMVLAESGAPPDDPMWPLLRQVRALPAEAVATVAGWRPAPLEQAADPLRRSARRYAETVDGLPAVPPWEGESAGAFQRRWTAVRAYVRDPGAESMVGRLEGTATYLDALVGWVERSRRAVAAALADVLGSAEAVTVVTSGPAGSLPAASDPAGMPVSVAAARIAARVLAPVAAACEEGRRLHEEWRPRLGQLDLRAPRDASLSASGRIRIRE